jgi:hypothetical protein
VADRDPDRVFVQSAAERYIMERINNTLPDAVGARAPLRICTVGSRPPDRAHAEAEVVVAVAAETAAAGAGLVSARSGLDRLRNLRQEGLAHLAV